MNNTPLDEIRKALDAANEYPLHAEQEPWSGNDNLQYWVSNQHDGIGAFVSYNDAYLAANAPTWLRSLLEDNEKLRKERDAKLAFISKGNDEDMYWLQEENIRLSSELAAKDKVLQWYGGGSEDGGEKARSILEQYARSAIDSTAQSQADEVSHDQT